MSVHRLTNSIPPDDIWRGLGRRRPHIFMLFTGVWVCMTMKPSGCLLAVGHAATPFQAYVNAATFRARCIRELVA